MKPQQLPADAFETWWNAQSVGMRNPASKASAKRGWEAALRAASSSEAVADRLPGEPKLRPYEDARAALASPQLSSELSVDAFRRILAAYDDDEIDSLELYRRLYASPQPSSDALPQEGREEKECAGRYIAIGQWDCPCGAPTMRDCPQEGREDTHRNLLTEIAEATPDEKNAEAWRLVNMARRALSLPQIIANPPKGWTP